MRREGRDRTRVERQDSLIADPRLALSLGVYVCDIPGHRVGAHAKDRTNVFSRTQSPGVRGRLRGQGWGRLAKSHQLPSLQA